MQEIKLQPFIQEVLQKNTYISPRKALQTLVVTPSIKRNAKICQKILLQQVRITKSANNPREGANFRPHL
jgi:hypothetical protein